MTTKKKNIANTVLARALGRQLFPCPTFVSLELKWLPLALFNVRPSLFLTLAILFTPVAVSLFEYICGIIAISCAMADQVCFSLLRRVY